MLETYTGNRASPYSKPPIQAVDAEIIFQDILLKCYSSLRDSVSQYQAAKRFEIVPGNDGMSVEQCLFNNWLI